VYLVGLFILAMGVAFSVKTQLGISPINVLPYVLSEIFFWSQGTWIAITYSVFVLAQIAILGKAFKPINLLQFVASMLFGYFVNLCNVLIAGLELPNYPLRLLFLVISIVCIAIGIVVYLSAGLLSLSPEGLVIAAQQRTGRKFSLLKLIFDCSLVLIAFLFSFLSGNGAIGLREGTLINALTLAPTIGIVAKLINNQLKTFCSQ
jgi:uncharacterized membrane protein YczE